MAAEDNTSEERGGLPEKEWYTLDEIADRWGCTVADLIHHGERGKIEFSYVPTNDLGIVRVFNPTNNEYERVFWLDHCPVKIAQQSVRWMARAPAQHPIPVITYPAEGNGEKRTQVIQFFDEPKKGLVVMRAERDRFEKEYKLGPYAPVRDPLHSSTTGGARSKWPWGPHETELLRTLAEAAKKFWSLYDPEDPTTAPTNAHVRDWLIKERGLTDNIASAIATILRADNLPRGPRKLVWQPMEGRRGHCGMAGSQSPSAGCPSLPQAPCR